MRVVLYATRGRVASQCRVAPAAGDQELAALRRPVGVHEAPEDLVPVVLLVVGGPHDQGEAVAGLNAAEGLSALREASPSAPACEICTCSPTGVAARAGAAEADATTTAASAASHARARAGFTMGAPRRCLAAVVAVGAAEEAGRGRGVATGGGGGGGGGAGAVPPPPEDGAAAPILRRVVFGRDGRLGFGSRASAGSAATSMTAAGGTTFGVLVVFATVDVARALGSSSEAEP